ncbi:radical SAM/SPASM domain-containing protein [Spartinivicinus poritis]|uniref:SPASM domain-containing protein n=1 Tax=Spartinivicinus poritis TaxID=2994640 RepID=A0ABT5U601_9GAMM|nr:radical SAM protein [Spartinivicinus sp. A2-2]MDE1461793.1 SPASM domain-containing protein [Spartinivicinus sp. A2-2]
MSRFSHLSKQEKKAAIKQLALQNRERLFRIKPVETEQVAGNELIDIEIKPSRYNIVIPIAKGRALLFNSVNRHLVLLDSDEHQQWSHYCEKLKLVEKDYSVKLNRQLESTLTSSGFLVDAEFDEIEAVKTNYFKERQDKSTLMLTVAPTMACNFACGYCFQGLNKDLRKIDEKVPDAIYQFIESKKQELSNLSITWYGGEPLMGRETIFELSDKIIKLCDESSINYNSGIVTNGFFLTPKVAQKLFDRRCTYAQVTIDGMEEVHDKQRPLLSGRGSFKEIMQNIRAVMEETPFAIAVRVNVGQENLVSAEKLLTYLTEEGYSQYGQFSVYFAPIEASTAESGTAFNESLSKQEFNERLIKLRARATEAGLSSVVTAPTGILGMCVAAHEGGYVISPNGDLHKCWETAHDPSKRIGTIFDHTNSNVTVNSQLWENWSPFDNPVCSNCSILPMCGGFCPHRYVYYGSGDDNALPCPDWKWNTAEYLFSRAKSLGFVTDDDWLAGQATASAKQSGERHSAESLKYSQQIVIDKIKNNTGLVITPETIQKGEETMPIRIIENTLRE